MRKALDSFSSKVLAREGSRLQDRVLISPFQGKKRELHLNRKSYTIELGDIYALESQTCRILLPGMKQKASKFLLVLCPLGDSSLVNENSRYLLKSLGETPFRLNGSISYESFIERGDQVDIDYNRLYFHDGVVNKRSFENQSLGLSKRIIQSKLNILIEGETGTGKSYLANCIHQESSMRGKFVHVNLSSFSKSLIESELFGHVKGAFTGAQSNKLGAFCEADQGTLFLDEIDSLPLEVQTKLLLFLDSKEVRPVGGDKSQKVNVRLIFASGRPLERCVELREMRHDFFYRLSSGAKVHLKSLREDPERVNEICQQFSLENGILFSQDLLDFYQRCPWPGNIRQLLGHLNKKVVLTKGRRLFFSDEDKALLHVKTPPVRYHSFESLEKVKKDHCIKVFYELGQSMKKSCEVLKITPNTLRSTLKKADVLAS